MNALPILLFATFILVGTGGLCVTAISSTGRLSMAKFNEVQAVFQKKYDAQEELIAALTRKSEALENLSNERAKMLALYRQSPSTGAAFQPKGN